MSSFNTRDGTEIYYKDWGVGPAVVFSHGWPLSSDSWEAQMMHVASHGCRCIAHDRRGHGRSSQPWDGNDMDTYADDLSQLIEGMRAGHKNAFDCIKAFSETDFTEDLKKFDFPTLIVHGDDDQVVPFAASGLLSSTLVKDSVLKVYKGAPHGLADTHKDQLNADLLEFVRS